MKFESGNQMYEYLCSGRDLYSKKLGIYVFEYNDAHALCIYHLCPEKVVELIKDSKDMDEYWEHFSDVAEVFLNIQNMMSTVTRKTKKKELCTYSHRWNSVMRYIRQKTGWIQVK